MPTNNVNLNAGGLSAFLRNSAEVQNARPVGQGPDSADPEGRLFGRNSSMLVSPSNTLPPAPGHGQEHPSIDGSQSSVHSEVKSGEATQALSGPDSTAVGLKKATEAGVNVARRTFWTKFFTTALLAGSLVMMAVATGGLGAVALAAIGVTTALMAKSSLDTAMSYANWQNMKAELQNKPPPWPALANLPSSVRTDALASLLVLSGVSESKASKISLATDVSLGLLATAAGGFVFGGLAGAGISVGVLAGNEIFKATGSWLMARRQEHVETTAARARNTYDDLAGKFLDFSSQWDEQIRTVLQQSDPAEAKKLESLFMELLAFKHEQAGALDRQEQEGGDLFRLENKARKGIDGTGAVVNDATTGLVAAQVDAFVSPLPVVGVTTKTLRAIVEGVRTWRSENRDLAKEVQINELKKNFDTRKDELVGKIKSEIERLRAPGPPPAGVHFA
jgi:hypothetical protein